MNELIKNTIYNNLMQLDDEDAFEKKSLVHNKSAERFVYMTKAKESLDTLEYSLDWFIEQYEDYDLQYPVKSTQELKDIIDELIYVHPNANLNWIDVSEIEDMSSLFAGKLSTYNNFNGDISLWDTSNVKNMQGMFKFNNAFNGDISLWDTSNVKTMSYMFDNSIFDRDISGWDVSNVETTTCMFASSKFNLPIGNWNFQSLVACSDMFNESIFNLPIGNWNVSLVYDMAGMFMHSKFNQDISGWDVSKVEWFNDMFAYSEFNQDISGWDISRGMTFNEMFKHSMFDQDLTRRKWLYIINKAKHNITMFDMFADCPAQEKMP